MLLLLLLPNVVSKYVLHSFGRMVDEGITPDLVSFMNALYACNYKGLS